MPFTANQLNNFFTSNQQMDLSGDQRTALSGEGLTNVTDFQDFKRDKLLGAFKNCRSLDPPVPLSAKSSTRLLVASIAWHYYTDTGRGVTPTNMHFQNILRAFNIEWKAIASMAEKENELKLPVLSKTLPPLKWSESFKQYLYHSFGVRKVPLTYVIREKVVVDPEAPPAGGAADPDTSYDPLETGKPYGSSGSVLEDMIKRSSHSHPLFKSDNATVYSLIEQAARNSQYLTTIKPFENRKDGRGAWLALLSSHVGKNEWERIQRENSKWLMSAQWNGKKYDLQTYCSQHRAKYQQLVEASGHVAFQVPTEHTRVGYLISNIECSDAALQAAIAKVRTDNDGSRQDFEQAVNELLPVDPFLRNKAASKAVTFAISGTEGEPTKPGRGVKTGVDLRWYDAQGWRSLSSAEKDELREWRTTRDGKAATQQHYDKKFGNSKRKNSKSGKKNNKKLKAKLAALEKKVEENDAEKDEEEKVTKLAAALKESDAELSSVASNQEKHRSIARTILRITARKSK